MAKNRPSFGDSVSKGLQESYSSESGINHPDSNLSNVPVQTDAKGLDEKNSSGSNPYYEYHPKTGQRGGVLGRPRTASKRIQISVGCTEEEKQTYIKAAAADGRKLPDFVNRAIKEYILNHGLDKLI